MVIKFKHLPQLIFPATLLYSNYNDEWIYFEVYDLIRKLLLTSAALHVASPNTSTLCIYLLVVDTMALIILAYCKPYVNKLDNILSVSFILAG